MVRPKKFYGQHFLTSPSIAKRIAHSFSNSPENILEVGPGKGVLTEHLKTLPGLAAIKCVEIDEESVQHLLNEAILSPDELIQNDFLKLELSNLFQGKEFGLIGNFPYNISSQIVFKVLENKKWVPEMVGMFQNEVAERIAAAEGSKTRGILSVLTQTYFEVKLLFRVEPGSFFPPPKVRSAVIRLKRRSTIPEIADEALYRKVVKTGFNQRRKTLRNALKSIFPKAGRFEHELLAKRAEALSVPGFVSLTNALYHHIKKY